MRRLMGMVVAMVMVQGLAGCCCAHKAGFCDCQPPVQPCTMYGLYPPAAPVATVAPEATATPPAPVEPPQTPVNRESLGLPR